jgi:hypothetical protein
MFGPGLSWVLRLLDPSDSPAEVSARDDIDFAIPVDIEWDVGEILVVLWVGAGRDVPDLMLYPIRGGVPRVAAENVRFTVAIKIRDPNCFIGGEMIDGMFFPLNGLVGSQTMATQGRHQTRKLPKRNGLRNEVWHGIILLETNM